MSRKKRDVIYVVILVHSGVPYAVEAYRDKKTGRFASNQDADAEAYPVEYIVVGLK